jgi:hypothetical protein
MVICLFLSGLAPEVGLSRQSSIFIGWREQVFVSILASRFSMRLIPQCYFYFRKLRFLILEFCRPGWLCETNSFE